MFCMLCLYLKYLLISGKSYLDYCRFLLKLDSYRIFPAYNQLKQPGSLKQQKFYRTSVYNSIIDPLLIPNYKFQLCILVSRIEWRNSFGQPSFRVTNEVRLPIMEWTFQFYILSADYYSNGY